ncbi:aquaporin [Fischerella thermalis CCMEE 5330]|uniref:Aquaporin n=1 Tax=Fischerella thermalis CCMEE 5330 TaxID=2019670 RepID=A0A2N6MNF3_9CYAN|nr:aquaporin [Fischerella thermalis CCMEE 5330]
MWSSLVSAQEAAATPEVTGATAEQPTVAETVATPVERLFIAEIIGTMILILLGDGVVANVVLGKTKGNGSGWIVITFGWGMAVFVGAYSVAAISGAHLNPAVTIGLAVTNQLDWGNVPVYIIGQFIGAFIGAVLVFVHYYPHFAETEDPGLKLAVFSTGPAIRNTGLNLVSEIIGTFMLIFGILMLANGNFSGLGPLPVALLVLGIGLSLGGSTGYAINPARDLGPRIAHFLLPIPGKGDSDWGYSWIPVVGPIIGAVVAGVVYLVLFA